MKTIFNKETSEELILRVKKLNEKSTALWGKMTVYQMLKHCTQWEEMIAGKQKYKRSFMGRLFGKIALKSMIKDELPVQKNMPTLPEFIIRGEGDVVSEREKWIALIQEHANNSLTSFDHPFFGKMTREQAGYLAYKHTDHHLRQFNC